MAHRLVLGCRGLGRLVVRRLLDRSETVRAVVDSEEERSWLSERRIDVTVDDPRDPATLGSVSPSPESVLIAAVDPDRIRSIAAAATDAFRTLPIRAVIPYETPESFPDDLPDEVVPIEPEKVIGEHVIELVASDAGSRVQQFRKTVRSIDGPIAVVMHDNPDPDAIASAVAVARLAASMGVEAIPCYFGEINRQENRALVNLLDLDLKHLDPDTGIEAFEGVALVDHSRPGVNNQLPESTDVDVVIDHHPPNGPVNATYTDLRIGAGATSTILVEYFPRLGVEFDETIATALLYGIRVDTDDFTRELSTVDFEAAASLCPQADMGGLERVESPSVSGDTFDTIARAIDNREVRGDVVTSCVGEIADRDTLAQAAERLLQLEEIDTSLVFGIYDDVVYASARACSDAIDLGEVLRQAFDQIGSAGGHARMAGAQIPIGMLAEGEDREAVVPVVRDVVTSRFYDELENEAETIGTVEPISSPELSFLSLSSPSAWSEADLPDDEPDASREEITDDEPDASREEITDDEPDASRGSTKNRSESDR